MKNLYIVLLSVILLGASGKFLQAQEPPFLAPIDNQKILVNSEFTLDIDASFANPQELYELTEFPEGMVINPVTGVITWTPTDLYQGSKVTVRAYNTAGSHERSFLAYVADALPCPAELVSYYSLDETSGSVYLDKTGGHNALAIKSVTSTTGMVENAQIFNPTAKSDNFLQVANNSDHNWLRDESFSFSFWFKYGGPNGFGVQALFTKGRLAVGQSFIQVYLDDTDENAGKIVFQIKDTQYTEATFPYVDKSTNLIEGEWYHIAAIYRGAAAGSSPRMSLYVNNSKLSYLAPVMANGDIISSAPLDIGFWSEFATNAYPFKGTMDEFMIFNKELSDAEVTEIFQDGIDGVAHCPKAGNVVPLVSSASADTATQDELYSYILVAEDYAGESIQLNEVDLPSWLDFNASTGLLTGVPGNENTQDTVATFLISDGTYDISHELAIHVINANDPPEITTSPESTSVDEDTPFSFTLEATDLDEGDVITLSARNLPGWLSFTPSTGVLVGTPTNDQVQYSPDSTFAIALFATDTQGVSDSLKFDLVVTNINDKPVINSQSAVSTDRNSPVDIALTDLNVQDPDDRFPSGHELIIFEGEDYSASDNTITPENDFYGSLTVNVGVSDGKDTTAYNFAITVNFVNIAPEFSSNPRTSIDEDKAYVYILTADDPDIDDPGQSQTLTFSAVTLPDWLSFDPETNTLSGIPDREDVGEHPVILMVTDGIEQDLQEFTITVITNNQEPIIASTPTRNIGNYLEYTYTIVAADPDNDELTYSAQLLPPWLSFDPETHTLSGIPEKSHVGENDVILMVTDGYAEVYQEFSITVLDINSQPAITSTPQDTVYVNVLYTYQFVAIDHENDVLTITGTQIPAWLSFDPQSKVLSGTPAAEDIGSHNVTITVTDGSFTVKQQFVIVVTTAVGVNDNFETFSSSVYPNPASDYVFFEVNDNMNRDFNIEISDITGKVVYKDMIFANSGNFRVDVSNMKKGIYLFRLYNGNVFKTGKFLVK